MEVRILSQVTQRLRLSLASRQFHTSIPVLHQANPIGDYYSSILEYSIPATSSKPPTSASQPPISATPEPSILFSSRLSSPLERRSEIERKSTLKAGVLVPPRPEEPDNCCMSGCVNCVYDRYREELEEWATASREAEMKMKPEEVPTERTDDGQEVGAVITDVDGRGNGGVLNLGIDESEELFKDIPVGIREFMKQEKRLKEKRDKGESSGER